MKYQEHAKIYADYFETISPETVDALGNLLSDEVVFIDPFNRIEGKKAMVGVFAYMFETMTQPRFEVLDLAFSQERAYMKWRMTGIVKSAPKMPFDLLGMSEVQFNDKGQVILHHDHWDSASQLLSNLPYIGWITKRIMRLFVH